jgi:hypothetical protein
MLVRHRRTLKSPNIQSSLASAPRHISHLCNTMTAVFLDHRQANRYA